MSRFKRPAFNPAELTATVDSEAKNRLIFDWWCDEADRKAYIASLNGLPTWIDGRMPLQDDPAPPIHRPVPQGLKRVLLISSPRDVHDVLTRPQDFSNRPYALLGGGTFLLGQDPSTTGTDWHCEQRKFVNDALADGKNFRPLAQRSIAQAALTSLAQPAFDLASFAEQAALRYLGQLYGYAFHDHSLLEDASRATYRALQYVAIGQHFVSEPLVVPLAQQALGRLIARSDKLMQDYRQLARANRKHRKSGADLPDGVQPLCELGLSGVPLLKLMPTLPGALSGRERATVAATMLAGTVGNIQSAVCLLTQSLLIGPADELEKIVKAPDPATLEQLIGRHLLRQPPMTVLPRRALGGTEIRGVSIPAGTDCLLLLEGLGGCPGDVGADLCPHAWGSVLGGHATHACPGESLSLPLIAALVQHTLRLPSVQSALDPLTGERLEVERLWGFGCTRYPLRFERDDLRRQKNLIVSMRVKAPISDNAARLRRLIAAAVPRIDHLLTSFGHLHFAWFEFTDDDTHLVLRTIYDGDFDAYIAHFAQRGGDLFDGLFEYLEGGSPRPVVEHQREFIEVIRTFNRAPLAGYLYSAYPGSSADQIRARCGKA